MNLDGMYIVVFIRQNMFPDHQMVHTFHLGFLIGKAAEGYCQKRHTMTGHPSVLLFGCKDDAELQQAHVELTALGIEHIAWLDPDSVEGHDDFGDIGVVSQPITKAQRNKLKRYRTWTDRNNTCISDMIDAQLIMSDKGMLLKLPDGFAKPVGDYKVRIEAVLDSR